MAQQVTLTATAAMGLESVVASEVKQLGYEVEVDNGKVTFDAPISAIPRCNLWLRSADRVKLQAGRFQAVTFDELFEKTKALPWENFIMEDGKFPVSGKSVKSELHSVPDCQAIVKKAIAERLKLKYGVAGNLPETSALFKVEVALHKDEATLTIDTSGTGLHKRGYRVSQGEAPLKETMAAALILLTNWKPDYPLLDPFCGSGTSRLKQHLSGRILPLVSTAHLLPRIGDGLEISTGMKPLKKWKIRLIMIRNLPLPERISITTWPLPQRRMPWKPDLGI